MPIPLENLSAASRLTAAVFDAAQNVFGVIKPSDQSVTSSTVLVNDTALLIASANLVASATYRVDCMLDYEGGTNGSSDIKVNWVIPAGSTLILGLPAYETTTGTVGAPLVMKGAAALAFGTSTAGTLRALCFSGTLTMSSTLANLQLQWAQNTSSATATIVHAGSYLTVARIT